MPVDLFSRVRGAGCFHYKGQDFWTKDVGNVEIGLKPFSIDSDAYGPIARRGGGRLITVSFTPVGVWTAAQLAVIFPYLNPRIGDFNTPIRNVTAVTYGAGTITVPGHGFITGTGIRIGGSATTTWTLPTGLAANTTYYVIAVDANTISLATTEANAIADTAIVLSSNGSGTLFVIQNTPLTITTVDGVQLAIWNAAIADMPALSLAALVSTMKAIKFEGYTLHGQNWSDANSLYTLTTGNIGAVPPNQAQIPSVPFVIDWATRLPVTAASDANPYTLTIPNHGLVTEQAVTLDTLSAGATLPAPFVAGTTYYVIVVDANTISLATSGANALVPTPIVMTSVGSGTFDVVTVDQAEGIQPREAIDVSFPVTWAEVSSGGDGLNCRSITKVEAKIEFTPTNMSLQTLLTELALQGGTAALGQNLALANLDIYGPGFDPFIRIYGAALEPTSLAKFGSQADRIDKLSFMQQRTFRGSVPNPIASVGVAAPTS